MEHDYIFKLLIETTCKIQYLYKELFELEVQGLKDSSDYKTMLEQLKEVIDAEKRFYIEKAKFLISHSNFIQELNQVECDIEQALLYDDQELVIFRIFNKFINLTIPAFENSIELDKKIEMEHAFNLFNFSILDEECCADHPNDEISINLNHMKYNDIFTYHLIEEQLIDCDFYLPYPRDILATLYQYGKENYFVELVCGQYNFYMEYIMLYDNESIKDPEMFSVIEYVLCKIKSCLILLPENLVKQIHQNMKQNIQENQKKNKEKNLIWELLNQNIYDAKEDRKKYIL